MYVYIYIYIYIYIYTFIIHKEKKSNHSFYGNSSAYFVPYIESSSTLSCFLRDGRQDKQKNGESGIAILLMFYFFLRLLISFSSSFLSHSPYLH